MMKSSVLLIFLFSFNCHCYYVRQTHEGCIKTIVMQKVCYYYDLNHCHPKDIPNCPFTIETNVFCPIYTCKTAQYILVGI